jgi:hypothetical protein
VSRLAGEAAGRLGASGGARRDEIVATLEAASSDDQAAGDLVAGRLTKDLTPSGFGSVFGLGDLPEPPPRSEADEEAEERARKEAEAASIAAARKKADEAWAHVAELEQQLAGARRRAEELDREAGR